MKFLCDQMLGTLAKWLRLFGFDTFYANSEISDDDLLDLAINERRVLITRDKELLIKSKKNNIDYIEIESIDLNEQLQKVLENIEIDKSSILSRCSLCNSIIEKIDKEKIKEIVPKRVFKDNDKFWYCPNCEKAYWMGTHYDKIITKINDIKKRKNTSIR